MKGNGKRSQSFRLPFKKLALDIHINLYNIPKSILYPSQIENHTHIRYPRVTDIRGYIYYLSHALSLQKPLIPSSLMSLWPHRRVGVHPHPSAYLPHHISPSGVLTMGGATPRRILHDVMRARALRCVKRKRKIDGRTWTDVKLFITLMEQRSSLHIYTNFFIT
jgi:hypothetical protein